MSLISSTVNDSDVGENTSKKNNLIFVHLFEKLIGKLIQDHDLTENAVKEAITDMVQSFRSVRNGKYPTDVDFNNMNYCVGYLHKFATCHAVMVYHAILKILKSPRRVLFDTLSSQQKLQMVCVGSGPGSDIVGFLSVLSDHVMKLEDLDITVVDKMSGWDCAFADTVQLLKDGDFGDLSGVFKEGPKVTTSYLQEDLEKTFSSLNGVRSKLESADVILLVKVVSHIPSENKPTFLANIETCMKPGSMLFFVDCPFPTKEFSALTSLKCVYKSRRSTFFLRHKGKKFGHKILTGCHAYVRVFVKEM